MFKVTQQSWGLNHKSLAPEARPSFIKRVNDPTYRPRLPLTEPPPPGLYTQLRHADREAEPGERRVDRTY